LKEKHLYNEENKMTAQEIYQAFLDAQKVIGYKLGDLEGTPEADMLKYTELKLAAQQEAEIKKAFYKERDADLEAFRKTQEEAFNIKAKEWQVKEDNL
jgi:hypothetical protein